MRRHWPVAVVPAVVGHRWPLGVVASLLLLVVASVSGIGRRRLRGSAAGHHGRGGAEEGVADWARGRAAIAAGRRWSRLLLLLLCFGHLARPLCPAAALGHELGGPELPLLLIHDALWPHPGQDAFVVPAFLTAPAVSCRDLAVARLSALKLWHDGLLVDAAEEGAAREASLAAVVEVFALRDVTAHAAHAHLGAADAVGASGDFCRVTEAG